MPDTLNRLAHKRTTGAVAEGRLAAGANIAALIAEYSGDRQMQQVGQITVLSTKLPRPLILPVTLD